mmetsp:Transcript_13416/g.39925  ORF Transcript_13416/g.39925 Transcript_13416/m.39925 type:complete len:217 (+) Transcript_13416:52-702(+)
MGARKKERRRTRKEAKAAAAPPENARHVAKEELDAVIYQSVQEAIDLDGRRGELTEAEFIAESALINARTDARGRRLFGDATWSARPAKEPSYAAGGFKDSETPAPSTTPSRAFDAGPLPPGSPLATQAETAPARDISGQTLRELRRFTKRLARRTCAVCSDVAPMTSPPFKICGRCLNRSGRYCSPACFEVAWKASHRAECDDDIAFFESLHGIY